MKGKAAVLLHVDRMELGLFGDSKALEDGVCELRIHMGPGYRVYYAREGQNIYLLLCGGSKSTQKRDLKKAKQIWLAFNEGGKNEK